MQKLRQYDADDIKIKQKSLNVRVYSEHGAACLCK